MISALVPAKSLDHAKGRLAELLQEHERRELALTMLEDVVRALGSTPSVERVYVVSPDQHILREAERLGAEAIAQPPSVSGINEALKHGARVVSMEAPSALLVLLADVPAVSPDEIEAIVHALPAEHGAVICPAQTGGTSALALRPPDAMEFRFGPDSFAQHEREAAARGVPVSIFRAESLWRDIDEPVDLRYLLTHATETATHRMLIEMRINERLGSGD